MFVELLSGVRIDGAPLGAGMCVECPADIGGYLTEKGWGRKRAAAHKLSDGRPVIAYKVRKVPGTSEELSEWPSWMRPAWMRPDGRAVPSGDDRQWVPARCRSCQRFGYRLKDRLPQSARRDERADSWVIECERCRPVDDTPSSE